MPGYYHDQGRAPGAGNASPRLREGVGDDAADVCCDLASEEERGEEGGQEEGCEKRAQKGEEGEEGEEEGGTPCVPETLEGHHLERGKACRCRLVEGGAQIRDPWHSYKAEKSMGAGARREARSPY